MAITPTQLVDLVDELKGFPVVKVDKYLCTDVPVLGAVDITIGPIRATFTLNGWWYEDDDVRVSAAELSTGVDELRRGLLKLAVEKLEDDAGKETISEVLGLLELVLKFTWAISANQGKEDGE